MNIRIDHIVMGTPCQLWVKRDTGSMFPILLNSDEAKEVMEVWLETEEMVYDPVSDSISFVREKR